MSLVPPAPGLLEKEWPKKPLAWMKTVTSAKSLFPRWVFQTPPFFGFPLGKPP